MSDKKPRKMRYSDVELSLIKNTFGDNEELLYMLRKVFLQLELSEADVLLLTSLRNHPETLAVLRKTLLPTFDGDAPLNQIIDLWMTVELKGKNPEEGYLELMSRQKLIQYLDQQLAFVESGTVKPDAISIADCIVLTGKTKEGIYCNMIMRNTLVQHIEMQLSVLSILAEQKNETPEQARKRVLKNSSK